MIGTTDDENLQFEESCEFLVVTHGNRVCAYRAGNGRFSKPLFKEEFQTCIKQISYCGVVSHHKKIRIKVLTLGSRNLLLHATTLWSEAVSTIMCLFLFKETCQR